jgi:hypothetical protein
MRILFYDPRIVQCGRSERGFAYTAHALNGDPSRIGKKTENCLIELSIATMKYLGGRRE